MYFDALVGRTLESLTLVVRVEPIVTALRKMGTTPSRLVP